MEKQDSFDNTGEDLGYISLDQALLQARVLARQDEARYLQRLSWDEIVWTEYSTGPRRQRHRRLHGDLIDHESVLCAPGRGHEFHAQRVTIEVGG